MSLEPQQKLCPFCSNPNFCGVTAIGGCWCGNVEIPMEMIELLPEPGKSCICLQCVEIYNRDAAAFTVAHRTTRL